MLKYLRLKCQNTFNLLSKLHVAKKKKKKGIRVGGMYIYICKETGEREKANVVRHSELANLGVVYGSSRNHNFNFSLKFNLLKIRKLWGNKILRDVNIKFSYINIK